MTERREIKQRSPAVWAKVKAAYLVGEPAASVARRFDVGYGNLRYRAHAEGWTRKAAMVEAEQEDQAEARRLAGAADDLVADAVESQVAFAAGLADPQAARQMAIARASALLAAGRAAEATALLKAAETLGRLTEGEAGPGPEPEPDPTPEEMAAQEAQVRAQWEAAQAEIEAIADALARKMLAGEDPGHHHSLFAHRWRAEVLGPEVAKADYERAKAFSSSPRDWTKDGELLPAGAHDDRNWGHDGPRVMAMARGWKPGDE